MKDRLIKSDEEQEYLIRKSGRERRCECSPVMILIFTIVMTFVFLGKLICMFQYSSFNSSLISRLQFMGLTSHVA